MKTFENKEINYSLHNNENFKKELESEISDVVEKISKLFIEYFKFITENIKLKKSNLSKFIITRGLDTIVNVFNHILFYTKNLDVTYFHCQKAFYFYVEFIGQISEDEKMFLQLSSRDATTYVYKKTIFEINNEFKKKNGEISECTRLKLDIINHYIDLYKTLLIKIINNDFKHLEKMNIIENIFNRLNNLTNKTIIKKINSIIDVFYYQIKDVNYFLSVCMLLVKKIAKNQDVVNNCLNNLLSDVLKDKLLEPPDKFINWLMS